MDCIFCKIVAGEIPSKKVFENDQVLAFEDISPIAPVHILVIPKKHIDSVHHSDEEDECLMGHMLSVAKKIAQDMGFASGYRLVINSGVEAGQTVMHLHLHIIAGRQLGWPPG